MDSITERARGSDAGGSASSGGTSYPRGVGFTYSDEEIETLKDLFCNQYLYVKDIAYRLGRSTKSVEQKIRHLGLKRDQLVARFVQFRGIDILKHGKTADEIRQYLRTRMKKINDKRIEARKAQSLKAAAQFTELTKTHDRAEAAYLCRKAGASYRDLAKVMQVSPQGALNAKRRHEIRLAATAAKAKRR